MPETVAALYVERGGPYFTMDGVDPWDVTRDARTYPGPWPVVAHPPCGPWGELRHLYQGNEHDCAGIALESVRRWGGILEHPHRSKFWGVAGMPAPGPNNGAPGPADDHGGFCVTVNQVSWGHVARKRTTLYMVGISADLVRLTMRTGGTPTHWVAGSRNDRRGMGRGGKAPPGIKFCSAQQRRRTPLLFAEWLVSLARSAWTFGGYDAPQG